MPKTRIPRNARRWSLALLVALTVAASASLAGSVGAKENTNATTSNEKGGQGPQGSVHVMMAVDWGEGQTGPAAFEIKDFSFGVENPTTIGSATGGAGAGKIKFNEFTIKKTTDKASPAFFKNCAVGAHYKQVTIEMRKAGGDPTSSGKPFVTFKFETVFTTKIDWSGPGDEGPEESITFVYGKLGVVYHQFNETTGGFDDIAFAWDQVLNREA